MGDEKLQQIQTNDSTKLSKCQEHGILLHTINTCAMKHFKEVEAKQILDTVIRIIKEMDSILTEGFEPPTPWM